MSSPTPEEDDFLQSFSILLTVYLKVKKTSMKGKTTSKEEKSIKMKELLFTPSTSNYIEFLKAVLLKHGPASYEVTEKKHFPLKYIPLTVKGQCILDAIDVNNIINYRDMVKKLSEEKLSTVKGTSTRTKKADLNYCLVQWHLKLQKVYKNKHDEGLTYISPLGPLPLMPAMIHDWCLALEEGQATIAVPLNIESFNMANKAPVLHPVHKAAAQPASPAMTDLNSLTLAILLQTLAQLDSGLQHSPTASAPAPPMVVPPTLQTPTWQRVNTTSSPPIPSLTQLAHYLQYVETNLGVHHALSYRSALELHGIRPDILPDVDDKLLADLGISAGNAIHLKKALGHEPPLKRANTLASEPQESQPPKWVFYKKQFHDGGSSHFNAPPMQQDDNTNYPAMQDYDLFYFCEMLWQWFPVPPGYTVDEDAVVVEGA
ncbi:hypothetical protein EDC04DRAFT_2602833 [Pisolithus marmoratus]|nr:hypothetical protein EDC04DRAFT_2602833 [Pisolithus marmoratus]